MQSAYAHMWYNRPPLSIDHRGLRTHVHAGGPTAARVVLVVEPLAHLLLREYPLEGRQAVHVGLRLAVPAVEEVAPPIDGAGLDTHDLVDRECQEEIAPRLHPGREEEVAAGETMRLTEPIVEGEHWPVPEAAHVSEAPGHDELDQKLLHARLRHRGDNIVLPEYPHYIRAGVVLLLSLEVGPDGLGQAGGCMRRYE